MSVLLGLQGGASTPSVASWQGLRADAVRRPYAVATIALACAFVPVVSQATPTDWRPSQPDRVFRPFVLQPPAIVRGDALEQFSAWIPNPASNPTLPTRFAQSAIVQAEALEQLAVPPLSWRGLWPDTTRRAALTAAAMQPALAYADQALAIAVPALSWAPSYPDLTRRALLWPSQHPAVTRSEALEQFAIPPLSWKPSYPDRTWAQRLTTAAMHVSTAYSERDLAVFVPPLSWAPCYPDITRRAALSPSAIPPVFRAEAVEQFSVPPLSWQGYQPHRGFALRLHSAQMQACSAFAERDLTVVVPALSWAPSYPDMTRRAALPTSAIPTIFRAESLEQFAPKLLWGFIGPDRTWRNTLAPSQMPAQTRVDVVVIAPTLSWQPNYPATTRRNALHPSLPPTLFKGEAIEQFAPKLQWNAFYPGTTRRAAGLSPAVMATSSTFWAPWDPFAIERPAHADTFIRVRPEGTHVQIRPESLIIRVRPEPDEDQ
jgi:hypothetical protein